MSSVRLNAEKPGGFLSDQSNIDLSLARFGHLPDVRLGRTLI